jgi:lipoprotein-anchoring transpeptidase ErfK/SrfK
MQTELDEFRSPNRKPWLILLVVAVAGVILWDRTRGTKKPAARAEPPSAAESAARAEVPVEEQVAVDSTAQSVPPSPPPPAEPVDARRVETLLSEARRLVSAGDRAGARAIYLRVLARPDLSAELRGDVEKRLGDLNVELALNPYPMPEKTEHVVRSGDSLEKIARKFKTTVQSIQRSNGLANPNLIKAGDRLRILTGTFKIDVSTSEHTLLLTLNNRFFKRYLVGTGKMDKTPLGTFEITDKISEPVWWRPDGKEVPYGDPENILGTHWMTLRATGDTPDLRGYGIHGTWEDDSIGKAESAGCIRMRNTEVEELYALVPPGTPVRITK